MKASGKTIDTEGIVKFQKQESIDQNNIEKIADFRKSKSLPKFNPDEGKTGTTAFAKISNQEFYGLNSSMERGLGIDSLTLRKEVFERVQNQLGKLKDKNFSPDGQAFTHAEAYTLILAEKQLGKLPEKVTLYVDRKTCNQCLGRNGLPLLAELYGIKELTVIDTNGRKLLIRPNKPTEIIAR